MRKQGSRLSKTVKVWVVFLVMAAMVVGLIPPGSALTAFASGDNQVTGIIWRDNNGDGVQNEGENPISVAAVALSDGAEYDASALTDEQGQYSFVDVPAGTYSLSASGEGLQPGSVHDITVADGEGPAVATHDMGLVPVESSPAPEVEPAEAPEEEPEAEPAEEAEPPQLEEESDSGAEAAGAISGMVWHDADEDGMKGAQENTVPGFAVRLYKTGDLTIAAANITTDENGAYTFDGLEAGSYRVGVGEQTLGGVDYLLPIAGIQPDTDNKFDIDRGLDTPISLTEEITIEEGDVIEDIGAGVRVLVIETRAGDISIDLATPTSGTGFTYDGSSTITFDAAATGKSYVITGAAAGVTAINFAGVQTTVTLNGITLTGKITLGSGATITMLLAGDNTITGSIITTGASLTIDSASSAGSANGTLAVTTPNNNYAAAIGGGSNSGGGTIAIEGGTVTAVGGGYSAGIGSGKSGGATAVTITGHSVVTAVGGMWGGSALGGGDGGAPLSYLKIDHTATVRAYNGSSLPAIHSAVDNAGTGYYVNNKIVAPYGGTTIAIEKAGRVDVCAANDRSNVLFSLTFESTPGNNVYRYAYTTGAAAPGEFAEILYGGDGGYRGQMIRTADGGVVISSVNSTEVLSVYRKRAYSITYNANGGTGTERYQFTTDMTYTGLGILPSSHQLVGFAPPNGMAFKGWNTAADGSGMFYTARANHTLTGNLTLYAQWGSERYLLYKDSAPGALVSSHYWLRDAVFACADDGAYTIVLTEDDTDMSNREMSNQDDGLYGPVTIPAGKTITLTSGSYIEGPGGWTAGGPFTITQRSTGPNQSSVVGDTIKGAHIHLNGTLTLENVTLAGMGLGASDSRGFNGGICANSGAVLTMNDGAVIEDCVNREGGGIAASGATLTMNGGAVVRDCITHYRGGGIDLKSSEFTMKAGSAIQDCRAVAGSGGGLYAGDASTITMEGGSITNNFAVNGGRGGGVYVGGSSAVFIMKDGSITHNDTSAGGGGVYVANATFRIEGGSIADNTATVYGGGIFVYGSGNVTIKGGSIAGNEVTSFSYGHRGGGIFINEGGTVTMEGGSITGNKAHEGGGIGVYTTISTFGTFVMTGGSITGNEAVNGGGIYTYDFSYDSPAGLEKYSGITITGGAVSGNTARYYYAPPENAEDFNDPAKRGELGTFDGNLLDNNNIVYYYIEVLYKANNGTSEPDYIYTPHPRIKPGESETLLRNGSEFGPQFTPPAPTANYGYVFAGWNTQADGKGTHYAERERVLLWSSLTLYAEWIPNVADVTVSKTIAGHFADLTKEFTFTVTIWNKGGSYPSAPFSYTATGAGTSVNSGAAAPAGTVTLDSNGKATFTLGHGQSITFAGVPADGHIQVVETRASLYEPSHTSGSGYTFSKGFNDNRPEDTNRQAMNANNLTITFTNTRTSTPPTGISTGGGTGLLGLIPLLGALLAAGSSRLARRKRRARG